MPDIVLLSKPQILLACSGDKERETAKVKITPIAV